MQDTLGAERLVILVFLGKFIANSVVWRIALDICNFLVSCRTAFLSLSLVIFYTKFVLDHFGNVLGTFV